MLDIFGRSGHVARSFRRRGRAAVVIDIAKHSCLDVLDPIVQQTVLGWLRSGKVLAVFLAPFCGSWSRARRGPIDYSGPPPPLRTHGHVMGRPGLSPADQLRVQQGNASLRFSIRVMRECLKQNIPVGLENPRTSWMWQAPAMARLLRLRGVRTVVVDQCQWGSRWLKPTTLVFACTHGIDSIERRCKRCGLCCSATGKPHIVLSGVDPISKKFWTALAQEYHPQFASDIAKLLLSSIDTKMMRKLALGFGN